MGAATFVAVLLLRDGTTTHRVLPADIRYLEAYGNYVKVHTCAGRLVITDTSGTC